MSTLLRLAQTRTALIVAAVIVVVAASACHLNAQTSPGQPQTSTSQIADLLESVAVVSVLPREPGYQRSCKRGRGCVFGPAWTDDTDAPMSHDGCDTRSNILKHQLAQVKTTARSRGCKVVAGVLNPDPYTGRTITSLHDIAIDHVVPLKRAWDSGAAHWSARRRATFANDPANLLAVSSTANSSKGSKGLSQWDPPNRAYRCEYARRYLTVARAYQLPITARDRDAAARDCQTR